MEKSRFFEGREILFTALVVGLLWLASQGLDDAQILSGRGGRYVVTEAVTWQQEQEAWMRRECRGEEAEVNICRERAPERAAALRAAAAEVPWFLEHCGGLLALIGFTGWAVLAIGRRPLPWPLKLGFSLALWGLLFAFLRMPAHPWLALVAIPLLFLFVAWATAQRLDCYQRTTHPLLYPLFLLLSGLGTIWLCDFAAMSHAKFILLGRERFLEQMLAAFALMSTLAGFINRPISLLLACMARVDRGVTSIGKTLPLSTILFYLLAAVVLVSVGYGSKRLIPPAAAAELGRMIGIALLAWAFLRWSAPQDRPRLFLSLFVLPIMASMAHWLAGDLGQLMTMGLAVLVFAVGLLWVVNRWRHPVRMCIATVVGLCLMSAGIDLVIEYGADIGRTHVADRIDAMETPFAGKSDFLSLLRWFTFDAPASGYGIGKTPWCGTQGELSDAGSCAAIPAQMQSDYVFAALAGVWGGLRAWSIAALTAWFIVLLGSRRTLPSQAPFALAQGYADWAARLFSFILLMQLFISIFGSLGVLPMTGVPFPLLAHGGSSLLATAIVLAAIVNTDVVPENRGG